MGLRRIEGHCWLPTQWAGISPAEWSVPNHCARITGSFPNLGPSTPFITHFPQLLITPKKMLLLLGKLCTASLCTWVINMRLTFEWLWLSRMLMKFSDAIVFFLLGTTNLYNLMLFTFIMGINTEWQLKANFSSRRWRWANHKLSYKFKQLLWSV